MNARGNILFLILLAIILFAALTYAVSSNMNVKEDQRISTEKAQTIASQIIQYTSLVENTVNRLKLVNGCSDTQLSFQNSGVSGYANGSAPDNCKVFDPAGGGVAWQTPDPSWFISPADAAALATAGNAYGVYQIPSTQCVQGMGTGTCDGTAATKDLVIGLKYLNKKICDAINAKLGYSTPGEACYPTSNNEKFSGAYYGTGQYQCNIGRDRRAQCIDTQTSSGYTFYQVILAR